MKSFALFFEALEPRLALDGAGIDVDHPHEPGHEVSVSEYQVEGMNWIDPSLPKGHNRHIDHVSWDTDPTSDGLVTVSVLVHDHGNLDADAQARIDDAIAEINSAAVNFGVNLLLVKVSDPGQLGLGFPSYERPEFVEREHSRVGLPNHLCEQIFVPTFRIATVERIPGEDMGVRQVLSSPESDSGVRWQ